MGVPGSRLIGSKVGPSVPNSLQLQSVRGVSCCLAPTERSKATEGPDGVAYTSGSKAKRTRQFAVRLHLEEQSARLLLDGRHGVEPGDPARLGLADELDACDVCAAIVSGPLSAVRLASGRELANEVCKVTVVWAPASRATIPRSSPWRWSSTSTTPQWAT